jgi:hypothetical protein
MAPPSVNLESYKSFIAQHHEEGAGMEDIRQELLEKHQIQVSLRTLQRRFKDWGFKKHVRVVYTEELRLTVASLYFETRANDQIMLHILQSRGFRMTKWTLPVLRKSMGLNRRVSVFQREESDRQLREIVREQLDNGQIEAYGRTLLDSHFRSHGINFAR